MAATETTALHFSSPSTSLSARVHPLVIFNICDCYVRRPDQAVRVIGTLLGSVLPDGTVDIRNSYAVPHNEFSGQVALDIDYHHNMLISHQKVNQKKSLLDGIQLARVSLVAASIKAYVSTNLSLGDRQLAAQFQEISLDLRMVEAERVGFDILKKQSVDKIPSDLEGMEASMERLLALIDDVYKYVDNVVEGHTPADNSVGRFIADSVASIPKMSPLAFDKLVNDSIQDQLLLLYLSSITRTQLSLAEKLNTAAQILAEQPQQTVPPLLMSMAMDELPLAILSNILSRVLGESLLRHRRVCKRWQDAIDDPYFRNSLHCSRERVVLYREFGKEEIHLLKIHEEAATRMIEIGKFPGPRGPKLRGTCNGLLFFKDSIDAKNNGELLINPLTKEILRLSRVPYLSPDMSVYGLGFDGSTNTYKMVQIDAIGFDEKTRNSAMGARIYNFDKRSWRACKAPPPLPHGTGPYCEFVFASGALIWFLTSCSSSDGLLERAVLSFDLTKEEFSLIPIPDVFFEDGGGRDFLLDPTRREWTRKYRIQPPFSAVRSDVVGAYSGDKLILLSPEDRPVSVMVPYNFTEFLDSLTSKV
ncbi:hypothetical protein NL676_030887 [Syzygium grande]|nr:hypothetical protein NL676_030887 [Syzygium grande]